MKKACSNSSSDSESDDDSDDDEDFEEAKCKKSVVMKVEINQPQKVESKQQEQKMVVVEEVKEEASPVQEVSVSKPDLNKVLSGQTSDGNWQTSSQAVLAAFIDSDNIQDDQINSVLSQVEFKGGVDRDTVYLTLLAWYILREVFADSENEWQLIVDKAKNWLEAAGVSKPANLVKKFTLPLHD